MPSDLNAKHLFKNLTLREMIKLSHTNSNLRKDFLSVKNHLFSDKLFLIRSLAQEIGNSYRFSVQDVENCILFSINNKTVKFSTLSGRRIIFYGNTDKFSLFFYLFPNKVNVLKLYQGLYTGDRITDEKKLNHLGIFLLHKLLLLAFGNGFDDADLRRYFGDNFFLN